MVGFAILKWWLPRLLMDNCYKKILYQNFTSNYPHIVINLLSTLFHFVASNFKYDTRIASGFEPFTTPVITYFGNQKSGVWRQQIFHSAQNGRLCL